VVVGFETPRRAWILLVGPHDDQDLILNVYAELYRLLDAEPQPDAGRDKQVDGARDVAIRAHDPGSPQGDFLQAWLPRFYPAPWEPD
jgi:hypothetical protein